MKKLIIPIVGVALLVTLGAARGCGYQDPGLPPHPNSSYPQTPITGSDLTQFPPDINMGSAPAPLEGTPCSRSGQERRDPGTGENIKCVKGRWVRV